MLSEKRKGRVTGSQAGAILGLCPWRSREDVMQDWLYGTAFKGNVATEHGNFYEEYAIYALSVALETDLTTNEKFYIHPDYAWLGATPDVLGRGFLCEIKCPYNMRNSKDANEFKSVHDQPHYYAQIQIEMACTGADNCYFFQWSPTGISKLEEVGLDSVWLDENISKLKAFYDEYHERKHEIGEDEILSKRYHIIKEQFDEAKLELDKIKEALISKANGTKRKFGNVSVYPVERKGSISYAKVVKEHCPDVNLTPYTGQPSTSWVVK